MTLDPDLQRILNVGAKIYDTTNKRQGRVYSNNQIEIVVDYSKGKYQTYPIDDFCNLLTSDVIVANSRVTQGNGESFKIKPREVQPKLVDKDGNEVKTDFMGRLEVSPINPQSADVKQDSNKTPYQVGYINFTTNKFSTEPKKGYTKVEYRKSTEKVTLELTSDQLEELKKMGLV